MESKKIETCPFCGKIPVVDAVKMSDGKAQFRMTHYCTQMQTHIVTPLRGTRESAEEVWNFRT